MNEPIKKSRKLQKVAIITLAVLVTAVALFYLEEDWRGERAWEKCKAELEAKGLVVDWNKLIPPAVPDDQNFFTASSNILIRFKKAQTPEEHDAATKSEWLLLAPSNSNSYPTYVSTNTKPLVVAELHFISRPDDANQTISSSQSINLDDPAARFRVLETIETNVGRGLPGVTGIHFSEVQLTNMVPVQITARAKLQPAIGDLESFIAPGVDTNLGRIHLEATGAPGNFQVRLLDVQATAAADYLKWSDQFAPAFDEIREALKRPYAILPGDYSEPYMMPIPNFVTMRAVAQTLGQRAQCHLLLHEPEAALRELTLIHEVCRVLQKPPIGKPETLVEAMINVAIHGLYAQIISEGFRLHEWQKPQLEALQEQLQGIDLPRWVAEAFRDELAADADLFGRTSAYRIAFGVFFPNESPSLWARFKNPLYRYFKFAPRGWIYQNLASLANLQAKPLDSMDVASGTIIPSSFDKTERIISKAAAPKSPYNNLLAIALPNYSKAMQTTAYNQNLVNEAEIACALERYLLTDGEYPATLEVLEPSFMEKLPHDIIGGGPLRYRRTDDGKFVLYSIGWNERDDGGKAPGTDLHDPDWVWPN
jgi:hypothetical protein